jgi:hypothetical protein
VTLCDDADEVSVAHDLDHARQRRGSGLVELTQRRAHVRRAQYRAAQHPRQAHVRHVDGPAGHDVATLAPRNGGADEAQLIRALRRDPVRHEAVERTVSRELGVRHGRSVAFRTDGAQSDLEVGRLDSEPSARTCEH